MRVRARGRVETEARCDGRDALVLHAAAGRRALLRLRLLLDTGREPLRDHTRTYAALIN